MRDRYRHTCRDEYEAPYTPCEACDLRSEYQQEQADDARAEAEHGGEE